ncbi:unnamed protein product [Symbiodinium microadriaticum]|nr:unnamed protein product [Symbiodinium microadriaticum]
MAGSSPSPLPRALANPGQWCWFNAVLQALASINDPRWWAILRSVLDGSHEEGTGSCEAPEDLPACLASVLLYINNEIALEPDCANSVVCNLAKAIAEECGLSSACGEQQDAHEAFIQILEALHAGLQKRQLNAILLLQRPAWDPLHPWLDRTASWARATAACRWFQELWHGTLEERRVCSACGLVKVDVCPSRQAFRCLSLDMLQGGQLSFSIDLAALLHQSYGGKGVEEIEGLVCSRCSARASRQRCWQESLRGSLVAQQACRRLGAFGDAIQEAEHLSLLCPAGSPEPVLRRTTHFRSFRIHKAPAILTLHLRRLIHGPWGLVRLPNPVRCPAAMQLDKALHSYALASVVSHLGTANQGHFIAHRAWHPHAQTDKEAFPKSYIPLVTSGKVDLWPLAQWHVLAELKAPVPLT